MTYSMFTSADDHVRISALYADKASQGGIYLEDEEEIEDNAPPMTWELYFRHLQSKALSERFLWQREDRVVREWQVMRGLPITHMFRHCEASLTTQLRALIKDRELYGKHVPQIMRDRLHQEENA
jgi:hypothetical protein